MKQKKLNDQDHSTLAALNEQPESTPTQDELDTKESDDYDLKTMHTI
jgi:hypothetical protein